MKPDSLNRRIVGKGGIDEAWKIVGQHIRKMRISPNVYKNQKNAAREKYKIIAKKQEQKLTSLQNICKSKNMKTQKTPSKCKRMSLNSLHNRSAPCHCNDD